MASASSMPSLGERQHLKSLLECSICLETFDEPRTLPCLHSFCKKCLENFVDGKCDDELNCPVCRWKFTLNKEEGVAGMTRNHFICNMIEVLSFQHQDKCIPCSHCEQPSVGRCVKCELFMCEKCLQSHNGYVGFRDHVVLTMEELSKPENQSEIKKTSKCTKHPRKKFKYYCETCDELICRHCMDFDHDKQHKFSPLEQAAQNKRKDLKTNSEILERTVADGNRKAQVLKEDRRLLNSNYERAKHVINERKEQLLGRLQKRLQEKTDSMIENARQVFDRKTENIEKKINETETFVTRVKASANMARSLLENGNDEEIVRSCQSIQENVDSPKGEVHDDLHDDVGVLPWNSCEIDKMLLAEITDIVEDIEDEAEVECFEKMPYYQASQLSEKEKKGEKGRGKPTKGETRKKEDHPTLQNQALADKEAHQQQGDQFHPLREAKPQEKGVTKPRMGDESLGRGHQQHAERKHEGKGDQTQRRDNNENQSPNTGSTPPRDVGSQSPPTSPLTSQINTPQHSGTTQSWGLGAQRNVPPTTSAPTSFRQVYDASLHYSTAQGQGRGIPGNGPMLTNPPISQPFSPHPDAGPHFSTAQSRHQGTQGQGNDQHQYPQTRSRGPQGNISPTGGAHSSSQSLQHPNHAQQTSQGSPRGRGQRNVKSYAPQHSGQAQAKDRSGTILGRITAKGLFK